MSWGQFLRREWGAATFVLTVVIGLLVVPLSLFLSKASAAPVDIPVPVASSTPVTASTPGTASSPHP